jgi:hypothetical protein
MNQTERAGIASLLLTKFDNRRTVALDRQEQRELQAYGVERRSSNPDVLHDEEDGRTELHYRPSGSLPWLMPDGKLVYPSWNSLVHTFNPQGTLLERKRMHQRPAGYTLVHRDEAIEAGIWMGTYGETYYFDRVPHEETGFFHLERMDSPRPVSSLTEVVENHDESEYLIQRRNKLPSGETLDIYYPFSGWDAMMDDIGNGPENVAIRLPTGIEEVSHPGAIVRVYDAQGNILEQGRVRDGLNSIEVLPYDHMQVFRLAMGYRERRHGSQPTQP